MASATGKDALRAPTSLVMDGMDGHDVSALRSRLSALASLARRTPPGSIQGDMAGRCWRFDVDGSRIVLSVSPTLTEVDVSPPPGHLSHSLSMEIAAGGDPSLDGRPELRGAVRTWRRALKLPLRLRRTPVQGPDGSRIRVARIVSALLAVHGDREALATMGMPPLDIRPPGMWSGPSIKDQSTGREVLSPGLAAHLLKDMDVEAELACNAKERRYSIGEMTSEVKVQTHAVDVVEAMRALADLPPEFHDPSCVAKRYRP